MAYHPTYAVHPMVPYQQSLIANLLDRTGRSIEDWEAVVLREGPGDLKACRAWLRERFGLKGTTTMVISNWALGSGRDDASPDAYLQSAPGLVDALYAGKRTHLRPLHDAIVERIEDLCPGARFSPTQTMLPIYRTHVVAHIKPSTLTRIDVGLCLRDVPESQGAVSLVDTGGAQKVDRITHRMEVRGFEDLNPELEKWLGRAWGADG